MAARDEDAGPFTRFGPPVPALPLVFAVPHAGRDYPDALAAASLLPIDTLAALEDRHADRLVAALPALGLTGFVARRARAWIDLNRDEREVDPAMVTPTPRPGRMLVTPKVRGGLGLIPRRVPGAGDIYARRIAERDIAARIAADHRPWHGAIADALASARARFGVALLVDLHSMPPLLPASDGTASPAIVLGDRHGRSCSGIFTDTLHGLLSDAGVKVARNVPYAGGHTLERHGRPAAGIHAIQIEIDRHLYLAPDLRAPGPGMAEVTALIGRIAQGLLAALDDARPDGNALAAE